MALTQICFGMLGAIGGSSNDLPALIANASLATQTLTPSSASTQTTITAPINGHRPCMRVTTDTGVYIAVGANPTASIDSGIHVPAGGIEYVFCTPGDRAAVVIAPTAPTPLLASSLDYSVATNSQLASTGLI